MEKLIDSGSFFQGEDFVKLLDFSQPAGGLLEKRASDERVLDFLKDLKPAEGKFYIHINAMGAGEYYGCNRNADYFPEENLKRWFKTFETGPAHLFRHHINKDPKKSFGRVIFAIYNERMHRVELIVEADRSVSKDIEDRIAAGDFPATSMACKTPYDECSICGNKAKTREDYCQHLRHELGHLYADGRRVMALNSGPLRFFDISIVLKPADITSSVLQKVANFGPGDFVSSAEIAEQEGLMDKYAEQCKLSELIKEIEGDVVGMHNPLLDSVQDPSEKALGELAALPLSTVCKKMAEMGISPSLDFLAELSAKRKMGASYFKGAGKIGLRLAMHFSDDLPVPVETPTSLEKAAGFDSFEFTLAKCAETVLARDLARTSLHEEWVVKRASEIGYGPVDFKPVHPDWDRARAIAEEHHANGETEKLLQLLIASGVAAVAAKSLISKYMSQKANSPSNAQTPTKILLVKSAEVLVKLAQDSLRKDLAFVKSDPIPAEVHHVLDPAVVARRAASGAIRLTHAPGSRAVATAVGQIFSGVEHERSNSR